MELTERVKQKKYVFQGKIINVRCDDAVLPNGNPCTREVVEHPGGVSVLCVHRGKIALVRQFRYAYGETLWEIPAGKLERGEDPARAAIRELGEETGLVASRVTLRFILYPTPGYCNEKIYIFEAEDVEEGKSHPDADEFLDVAYFAPETALRMVETGEIRDAKTIVALQSLALRAQK